MARRSKGSRSRGKAPRKRWLSPLIHVLRRIPLRWTAITLTVVAVALAAGVAVNRLEAQVTRQIHERIDSPRVAFLDLPESLAELALADLRQSIADLLIPNWTDERLCEAIALRLANVGWVAKVRFVRRTADARFEVSADYRHPLGLVHHDGKFFLVDRAGVRLPGIYRYDPRWKLIDGIRHSPAAPGEAWKGNDLQAGLAIIAALHSRPFDSQITAVLVDNFAGRIDPAQSHVELATDRAGGRIRWGSAPGSEIEENSLDQKLAILQANFARTGRVDAHHPVIDISTFPDRFTIPG